MQELDDDLPQKIKDNERESLREASTMDGALSKLLKPPTSQREGPCMLEHHEAGRAV